MKLVKIIKKCVLFLVFASLMIMMGGFLLRVKQTPVVSDHIQAAIQVPFKEQLIPISNKRPGKTRKIKYIVIHNTANKQSSAQNEVDYLTNRGNTSSTSFHMAVDDHEIVEAIPVTEMAFHAGTNEGNQYGIGIEICESGNFEKAEANAAKLTAYLMKQYNVPLSGVKTHHDFSGKDCPRLILDHWSKFLEEVQAEYKKLK